MEGHGRLEDLYNSVHERSGKEFGRECSLIEEGVSASYSMYLEIARQGKLDERRQYLLAFFYRNCVYLSAAYKLVRSGMLDPAGNNLRTVYETIIWQYAYLTDDGVYSNFREMIESDGQKLELIKQGRWSNTKERALENLRRKYSFQKMMKRLYTKERYEKFFYSQYWAFCQKSHSSIFGINHNTPNMDGGRTFDNAGDAEEARGYLTATLYLCAENMVCLLNCFPSSLTQERIKDAMSLANRINRAIPPAYGLAPEGKELPFVLRFREA